MTQRHNEQIAHVEEQPADGHHPPRAEDTASALAELQRRSAAARTLGAALGLDVARLARGEALDRLEVTATLPAESVLSWASATLREPFAALGADLALDLALAGAEALTPAPITASLRHDADPVSAFAAFQRAVAALLARQGDELAVEARLAIGKRGALTIAQSLMDDAASESAPPTTITVFYFAAAWQRLLTLANLPIWPRRGLLASEERARVLLGDATGHLAGPALDIIGAATPAPLRPLPISRAAWRQFTERTAAYTHLRAEEGHWSAEPLALTPAHLDVVARAPGLEATARRLATLRAALAAAYLASATGGSWETGLELRFAGPRPATCQLPPETGNIGNPISTTPDTSGIGNTESQNAAHIGGRIGNTENQATAHNSGRIGNADAPDDGLARLARWAFAHGSPDKLAIARECLARELPAGATLTLAELERAALPTLEAAKANFALYLRGRTEQYFKLRQSAQDAVAAYAETVRKAVADLTSDAVESLYRSAGLAIALVLAWLIQPATSLWAIRLGALLYTVYVAFILRLVLPAREEREQLESIALDRRLADLPELTTSERAHLRATTSDDDAYFARYFTAARWITRALLALGVLALVLFCLVPLAQHLLAAPAAPPHPRGGH